MVSSSEPRRTRTEPTSLARRGGGFVRIMSSLCAFLGISSLTGCSQIHNQRLEDCHKLAQSVQADNSRLKDVALKLRTENQDLSQRSIDDAKKIKTLADNNERLSRSVVAYQEERERMAAQVQAITREARTVGLDPSDTVRKAESDDDRPRSASRSNP